MFQMSRKRLIIIGILIAGILLTLIASSLSRHANNTDVSKAYALPRIFGLSTPYGNDSLLLVNGRSFVKYNYKTGKTTLLSKDTTTPNLTNIDQMLVTADKRYIVFHMTLADAGTTFDTQLTNEGQDSGYAYWWVYDTKSDSYKHLPVEVTDVSLNGDKLYALTDNQGQAIATYTLPDLQKTKEISVTNVDSFFAVTDGFIIEDNDKQETDFTKDGTVNTVLFKTGKITQISNDGSYALGLIDDGDKKNLAIFNIQAKSVTVIARDVSNQIAWQGTGKVAYRLAKDQDAKQPIFHVYDLTTKKNRSVTAVGDSVTKKSLQPTTFLDATTFIANDSSGNMFLVGGNDVNSFKKLTSYDKTIVVNGNDVEIEYYSDQTAFIITVSQTDTANQRDAIYGQLKKDGYNPDLLDIRLVPFTRPYVVPQP